MKLNIHKNIFLPVYLPYLEDYRNRYMVFYGGAGSGKSYFVAQALVYKALKSVRKILVLRKLNNKIKASVFAQLLEVLEQYKILDRCRVNRSDFTIILPNGSQFLCMGLDNQEKIKSIPGLTDAWLEEATDFTVDDFSQVDMRIRHSTALFQMLYLSFNPVSKANWCYKHFFEPNPDLEEFRERCTIVQTTYKDNPYLPAAQVEALKLMEKTNPYFYSIYALGQFGSLDKLIYNNWQSCDFDHTKLKGELVVGLDFGYTNDPTALIASVVVPKENRLYIFKEWGGQGYLNDAIADNIKTLGFAKSVIMADSAEQKSIDEIKRAGIIRIKPCAKGKGSILQGIQKLQQYEIIVHPSCAKVIEEFQNYCWKKDKNTNEYINEPVDKYNHYLDALRYSLQCLDQRRTELQTMDKSQLF